MVTLKKILLPVDFSERSLAATKYALNFAEKFGASIDLLHVIEDPVVYLPMFESYPLPSREEFDQYAKTRLENWILESDRRRCPIEHFWVHGTPVVEILKHAETHGADLIVMGTHGRGPAAHLFLGSVAEKVVRQAPCPVLTVRPIAVHEVEEAPAPTGE